MPCTCANFYFYSYREITTTAKNKYLRPKPIEEYLLTGTKDKTIQLHQIHVVAHLKMLRLQTLHCEIKTQTHGFFNIKDFNFFSNPGGTILPRIPKKSLTGSNLRATTYKVHHLT